MASLGSDCDRSSNKFSLQGRAGPGGSAATPPPFYVLRLRQRSPCLFSIMCACPTLGRGGEGRGSFGVLADSPSKEGRGVMLGLRIRW